MITLVKTEHRALRKNENLPLGAKVTVRWPVYVENAHDFKMVYRECLVRRSINGHTYILALVDRDEEIGIFPAAREAILISTEEDQEEPLNVAQSS